MSLANSARMTRVVASAGQTVLAATFPLVDATTLSVVRQRGDALTTIIGYALQAITSSSFEVVLAVPAELDDVYSISTTRPGVRTTDFAGSQNPKTPLLNAQLDEMVRSIQEIRRDADRAIRLALTDGRSGLVLPPTTRDKYLYIDTLGQLILKDAAGPKGDPGAAGGVQSVATVAALRARAAGAIGDVVETRGYYASRDGGGAVFEWDDASALADNGGSVIQPASLPATGRWMMLDAANINVLQFGARGTNSADDHPAAVAALAWLKSISGGTLSFPGNGRSYLFPQEVNVTSNIRVTGVGGSKPLFTRTALAASGTAGFFAIRDPAPAIVQNAVVEGLHITHAGIDQVSFVATAAQTVFTYSTAGVGSITDLVVFRNATLMSPSTPDYTYSGSTVTLLSPCTAGDVVRIGKVRSSHRSAGVYSEGVAFGQPNFNITIRDIDVRDNASLYCGVVWLYTNRATVERIDVQGVTNRAIYNYGAANEVRARALRVNGVPAFGVFAGLKITDYAIDNNQFDANNGATNVWWSDVDIKSCYRAFSWGGSQNKCGLTDFTIDGTVTWAILIQDLAQQSDRVFVSDGQIFNTGFDAILSNASMIEIGDIEIDGCQRGIALTNGTINATESRSILGNIRVANFSAAAFDFTNQLFLQAPGLAATVGTGSAVGLRTTGSQLCSFPNFKGDNIPGTAISLSATCSRHDLDNVSIATCGVGLVLGASGSLHKINNGRAYNCTTPISGTIGTNIVRYTDSAGVNQSGMYVT